MSEENTAGSGRSALAVLDAETAAELRKMVRGEGDYKRFTYTPAKIKNIWLTAADRLDGKLENYLG